MKVRITSIQNLIKTKLFVGLLAALMILNTGTAWAVNPPNLSTPVMAATNLNASFQISITAVAGAATYDIEISKSPSFSGTFPNYQSQKGSTLRTFTPTQLTYGGTYYMRWRANNTAFKTTTVKIKAKPITYAQITNGTVFSNVNTYIMPVAQHGVTSYDWQFDTVSTFTSGALISATTSASTNAGKYLFVANNFIANKKYYVRVRGYVTYQSLQGNWSTGANIKNFKTSLRDAPTLLTPTAGESDLDASFTIGLGMPNGSGTVTYSIEISKNGNFNDAAPNYQGQLNNTARTFAVSGLEYNTTYTIRWSGDNTAVGTTTVTTKSAPTTYAVNITNGQYFNVQTIGIQPLPQSGAVSYDWEFDTTSAFNSSALISANTLPSNNSGRYMYDYNNFLSGALYYVRVRANLASSTGPWTVAPYIKSFYSTLHLAVISSPTDAYVANRISLKLECNVVGGAATYEIQYSTDPTFATSTTVIPNRDWYSPGGWNPVGTLIVKSYDHVDNLEFNTTYYVRAHAYNSNQPSGWGSTISFTTGSPNISITNPANGQTNVGTTFTFALTPGSWIQTFGVDISTTSDFASPTVYTSANSKVKVTGMSNGATTYYARAKVFYHGQWWISAVAPISFKTCAACREASVAEESANDETNTASDVNVYPNPSADKFNVTNNSGEVIRVEIQDFSGRMLTQYSGAEQTISMGGNLTAGTYLLVIRHANGDVESKKVIKY